MLSPPTPNQKRAAKGEGDRGDVERKGSRLREVFPGSARSPVAAAPGDVLQRAFNRSEAASPPKEGDEDAWWSEPSPT